MKTVIAPLWLKIWLAISVIAILWVCVPCIGIFKKVCTTMPFSLYPSAVFMSGVVACLVYGVKHIYYSKD